jgi:hypothetical protein
MSIRLRYILLTATMHECWRYNLLRTVVLLGKQLSYQLPTGLKNYPLTIIRTDRYQPRLSSYLQEEMDIV